jgi:hypothetical protein
MTIVHIVIGVAALALNLVAFGWGAWAWYRRQPSVWFWRLLRGGQSMVVLEALLGGVLLLMGRKVSNLHLIYGVLPLVVSFMAEQLRISAAQMILDKRGFENAKEVGALSADAQRDVVMSVVRREIGVMTLSALVTVALVARAATVVH